MNDNFNYRSGDGFRTATWGPLKWMDLHITSLNYPVVPTEDDKLNYYFMIENLTFTLPCGTCRVNLRKNLDELQFNIDEHMIDRETFSRFVYNLHSKVNTMLGKKDPFSYEVMRDRLEIFRAKCNKSKTHRGCTIPGKNRVKSKCQIMFTPEIDEKVRTPSVIINPTCLPKTTLSTLYDNTSIK